jgi:hypothetical protein
MKNCPPAPKKISLKNKKKIECPPAPKKNRPVKQDLKQDLKIVKHKFRYVPKLSPIYE